MHDAEHAPLAPFGAEEALEVSFRLDYTEQFDQAGLFLRVSPRTWIKAGVEISDGAPQLGAASRSADAVTIRARVQDEPFRLVRVAPLDPAAEVRAGLFGCAPTRAGLVVTFSGAEHGATDAALHP